MRLPDFTSPRCDLFCLPAAAHKIRNLQYGKLRKMWLQFKVWWYSNTNAKHIPLDVREYLIRQNMKTAMDSHRTPEQKREFAATLMAGAISIENEPLSPELKRELVAAAQRLLDGVAGPCAKCHVPIYYQDATKIEDEFVCKVCYPGPADQPDI
jgi:formylmethanofuran dehydrogenase subunit E